MPLQQMPPPFRGPIESIAFTVCARRSVCKACAMPHRIMPVADFMLEALLLGPVYTADVKCHLQALRCTAFESLYTACIGKLWLLMPSAVARL
eukprot:1143119-Pelagomonas_calceolata.AAC.1